MFYYVCQGTVCNISINTTIQQCSCLQSRLCTRCDTWDANNNNNNNNKNSNNSNNNNKNNNNNNNNNIFNKALYKKETFKCDVQIFYNITIPQVSL